MWTEADDHLRAFANAASHTADVLAGDAENGPTGEEATRSLEISIACYLSPHPDGQVGSRERRPVAGERAGVVRRRGGRSS